jgi:protein SCO1
VSEGYRWRALAARLALLPALLAGGCGPRPPAATALAAPDRVSQIRDQHLPNVELTTHEGRAVRFYDDLVKGKVVAINFTYTRCQNACPVATRRLVEVQRVLGTRLGREITLLSISLDPAHDTPAVLNAYAQAHRAGPGWYFLTGKRDAIDLLRRRLGAYELDPAVDADRSQHTGLVILGNEPKGRWKAIAALSKPIRIRQAIERTILPPSQWPTGEAVVRAARYEENESIEPAELANLPVIN